VRSLEGVRAILFDYGNTLIAYGEREDRLVTDAFHRSLVRHGAPGDPEIFRRGVRAITGELIERATATGREVRRTEKIERVLERFGLPVTEETVEDGVRAISRAFVDAIEAPADLVPLLERLGARYRLALLSNYFLADPLHESLRKIGIERLLDPRVVSADIGWCKPHPRAFEPALAGLALEPAAVLMVGDNLTADVAGAAALGLRTAHTREHRSGALPYGRPEGNGVEPDVEVASLAELETLLMDT
jgi:putative hydrolase of the HAD superfamily